MTTIAFTSLFMLGRKSFWIDESFTFYISHTLSNLGYIAWHQEPNMWFYYFLLHFWGLFGKTDLFIRFMSAIFSILSVPVFYKIGEYLFSKRVALISSILLSLHLFFIFYAQEARSYSLLLFLIFISTYSFLRFKENNFYKVIYVISSSLAIYTHFYAGFILFAHLLYSLYKKTFKTYFISYIFMTIFTIPLLISPSLHGHTADYLARPTISNLIGTFYLIGGDFLPLVLLYLTLFLLGVLSFIKNKKFLFLFLWIFVPMFISFMISEVKPIYQSVYFVVCLPAFLLIVANVVIKIKNQFLYYFIIIALIFFSIFRLYFWYLDNVNAVIIDGVKIPFVIQNKNEDWRSATKYITINGKPDDVVLFYVYFGKLDYQFYMTKTSPKILELASDKYDTGGWAPLPEPNITLINSITNKNIWFVVNRELSSVFDRNKQYGEIEFSLSRNYKKTETIDFNLVKVEHFEHL